MNDLEIKAKELNFTLKIGQGNFTVIPLINGEPAKEEVLEELSEEEKEKINNDRDKFYAEDIDDFVRQSRELEKEIREKLRELEQEVALTVVRVPMDDLREKYRDFSKVLNYLNSVQEHILENLSPFLPSDGAESSNQLISFTGKAQDENPLSVYEVNCIVDNSNLQSSPVIYEPNPNFTNLFGQVERRAVFGTYTTDFTLIRAGSMISSNGGFLILDLLDTLTNPGVWPALKRVIRNKNVRIEDLGETYGWSTGGIKPEPVPVEVKVILVGSPMHYELLLHYDEDFGRLFKVKADFSESIDCDPHTIKDYQVFIEFHRQKNDLLPFTKEAILRVLQESSRFVADKKKLSTRFGDIRELLIEADHWARQEGVTQVDRLQIERAVEEKRFRSDLLDDRLRKHIVEGTLLIDVDGKSVGQVNGLAVLSLGDYSFGKPCRITAQTFMGEQGVINIERESKLSGNIHDKGVLILQGYMGGQYAQKNPLTLSASICFEQSYSGIDGDSASSTELYSILSSLSGLPISQGLAVTGSVNQRGEVQPIGGVNEKIEGYFEICKEKKKLNGQQGVLIPIQNVKNLILRTEVSQAVKEGKFKIFPIRNIDEGISVLTGIEAGKRDSLTGEFPEESVHGKVQSKLNEMFENLTNLRRNDENEEKEEIIDDPSISEKSPPSPEEPPVPPPVN
jgi:predicted ATP-dependent protease